jgi:septum formation protein
MRLTLLRQIGIEPDAVVTSDIDESLRTSETPRRLASRLAAAKALGVDGGQSRAYVLAADTVVAVGRRVLPKAGDDAEVRACLTLLSGRTHRIFTGVCLLAPDGRRAERVAESRVQFKRLSTVDIAAYARCGEGLGKAGGYAIQGRAEAFVIELRGSYTGVVGLPLYQTACLLTGLGFRVP